MVEERLAACKGGVEREHHWAFFQALFGRALNSPRLEPRRCLVGGGVPHVAIEENFHPRAPAPGLQARREACPASERRWRHSEETSLDEEIALADSPADRKGRGSEIANGFPK